MKSILISYLFILAFAVFLWANNDSTTIYTKADTVHWEKSIQGIMFDTPHDGDITFITTARQWLKQDSANGITFDAMGASTIWEVDSQSQANKNKKKDLQKECWKELKKREKP